MILSLDHVTFAYRRARVFDGLQFGVREGELSAVLGPNGSGKTTLLRIAVGYLRPTAGHVRLAGDDVSRLAARERARRVAVVPQDSQLAFDFSVRDVVMMGRAPHLGPLGLHGAADRRRVQEAMARAEVDHLATRSFHALSGGERQRVVLARALAQEARLLLLDEPTAHLDLKHRLAVHRLLRTLNRDSGLSVLVAGHDVNLAARYCRRLVLLKSGRIVADGAPDEVLTPQNLAAAYDVDVTVRIDPSTRRPYVVPLDPEPAASAIDSPRSER